MSFDLLSVLTSLFALIRTQIIVYKMLVFKILAPRLSGNLMAMPQLLMIICNYVTEYPVKSFIQ